MPQKTIDSQTLKNWLDNNEAILIDVRETAEHAAKNIPGAKNIPLGQLSEACLPDYESKKLVIHCGGGGRAGRACEKLLTENPGIDVYNLTGGLRSWAAAGYTVNKSGAEPAGNFCSTKH